MEQLTSILIGVGVLVIGLLVGLFLRRHKKYNDQIQERPQQREEVMVEEEYESEPEQEVTEEGLEEVVSTKSEKRLKPKPTKVVEDEESSGEDTGFSFDFIGLIPKIIVLGIVILVGLNILGAVCTTLTSDNSSSVDAGFVCTDKGNPKAVLWVGFVGAGLIAAFGMNSFWRRSGDI